MKADVKGFFHQIYIDENDSASFRFLWFEDETMTSIVEYEHAVHVFGGGSSPTVSTFTLQTHAEEVNDLFESDIKAAVDDQFYVDDYADSFKSIGEARRMRIDLTEGLRLGGFELTKWESPYPEILLDDPNISQVSAPVETTGATGGGDEPPAKSDVVEVTANDEREKSINEIFNLPENFADDFSRMLKSDSEAQPTGKTLGVGYHNEGDYLYIRITDKAKIPVNTKVDMLRLVASVYDPIGLISPYVLIGRIYFQMVNDLKIGWEDELPPDIKVEFNKWRESIYGLRKIRIPRWTSILGYEDTENWLICYSDASLMGFGVVCYIRRSLRGGGNPAHVAFLMSKSHVVPYEHAQTNSKESGRSL